MRRMIINAAIFFMSIVPPLTFSPVTQCFAAKVEGDMNLLRVLVAAQATGRSAFPRGALDATVHSVASTQQVDVKAHVVWDGTSTYWSYEQTVTNRGTEPEISAAQMIEVPSGRTVYWPAYKLAQTINDERHSSYRDELRLRPDDKWWFTSFTGNRTWSELFDTGGGAREPTVPFDKMIVRREGDNIIVDRHCVGRIYRITASLKDGANVVEHESIPSREHPEHGRGSFTWVQLPDKRWRLKHREFSYWLPGDGQKPNKRFEIEITSFDPNPVIVSDRFRVESLAIPDGVLKENIGPSGATTRRIEGQAPPTSRRLDELADVLRRHGFAQPNKEGR